MSLWQQYETSKIDDVLIQDVPPSMEDVIYTWLFVLATSLGDSETVAKDIKNKFRIDIEIPRHFDHNSQTPSPAWKLANFLLLLARSEPDLFFVIVDYMIHHGYMDNKKVLKLKKILDDAGHKYTVTEIGDKSSINERVSSAELSTMTNLLKGSNIYASEFQDAFKALYGPDPNYTASAGESFQALESALKFHLGEDKGDNLGRILNWLQTNKDKWEYIHQSDGQSDAQDHVISIIDFINKSYRKTKHGQADKKLIIEEEQAQVIIRATSLIIFELETSIKLIQ